MKKCDHAGNAAFVKFSICKCCGCFTVASVGHDGTLLAVASVMREFTPAAVADINRQYREFLTGAQGDDPNERRAH